MYNRYNVQMLWICCTTCWNLGFSVSAHTPACPTSLFCGQALPVVGDQWVSVLQKTRKQNRLLDCFQGDEQREVAKRQTRRHSSALFLRSGLKFIEMWPSCGEGYLHGEGEIVLTSTIIYHQYNYSPRTIYYGGDIIMRHWPRSSWENFRLQEEKIGEKHLWIWGPLSLKWMLFRRAYGCTSKFFSRPFFLTVVINLKFPIGLHFVHSHFLTLTLLCPTGGG